MGKMCRKCGLKVPNRIVIDGKVRNTQRRQFCLSCSPWQGHNTKKNILEEGKKICSNCKKEKPICDFHRKTGKYRNSLCKACLYEFQKERWTQRKKDAVLYLGGKCSKCGYDKNFSVLSFHHKNAEDKEFDWNRLRLMAKDTVKKELDKCDLLCSNCHGELHNPECKI